MYCKETKLNASNFTNQKFNAMSCRDSLQSVGLDILNIFFIIGINHYNYNVHVLLHETPKSEKKTNKKALKLCI